MNDIIRQRQLRDGFLKAQGTSKFAIVNPEYPIRRDKVKIICTGRPQILGDSYLTS